MEILSVSRIGDTLGGGETDVVDVPEEDVRFACEGGVRDVDLVVCWGGRVGAGVGIGNGGGGVELGGDAAEDGGESRHLEDTG